MIQLKPSWRVERELLYNGGEFGNDSLMRSVTTPGMIEDEPMLFGASMDFASENAGPLTFSFLSALDAMGLDGVGQSVVIDSRSHMLMPGMYPCIPGWHVDELPRDAEGKPISAEAVTGGPRHVMAIIGATSMTQFVGGAVDLPRDPIEGKTLYKTWTDLINPLVQSGALPTYTVKSGEVVSFGVNDLHRGVPATSRGWRWFIRATFGTRRTPENRIRKQTQVYMPDIEVGW